MKEMPHKSEVPSREDGEPSSFSPQSTPNNNCKVKTCKQSGCLFDEWISITEQVLDCYGEVGLVEMAIIIKRLCQEELHPPCDGCMKNVSEQWQVMGHDSSGRYSIWGACNKRLVVGIVGHEKAQMISCPEYVER